MHIIVSVEGKDVEALSKGLEHASACVAKRDLLEAEQDNAKAWGRGGPGLSGPNHQVAVLAQGEAIWTQAEQEEAFREGWGLFHVSGGACDGQLHVQYLGDEIEATGVPPGSFSPFDSDPQAQVHVLTRAEAGSALHRRALLAICIHPG